MVVWRLSLEPGMLLCYAKGINCSKSCLVFCKQNHCFQNQSDITKLLSITENACFAQEVQFTD